MRGHHSSHSRLTSLIRGWSGVVGDQPHTWVKSVGDQPQLLVVRCRRPTSRVGGHVQVASLLRGWSVTGGHPHTWVIRLTQWPISGIASWPSIHSSDQIGGQSHMRCSGISTNTQVLSSFVEAKTDSNVICKLISVTIHTKIKSSIETIYLVSI